MEELGFQFILYLRLSVFVIFLWPLNLKDRHVLRKKIFELTIEHQEIEDNINIKMITP